jgi:hypothetical protein
LLVSFLQPLALPHLVRCVFSTYYITITNNNSIATLQTRKHCKHFHAKLAVYSTSPIILFLCPDPDPVISRPHWSDPYPDLDPGLNKLLYLNFFGRCKSNKCCKNTYCFTIWFINKRLRKYLLQKNFQNKVSQKFI